MLIIGERINTSRPEIDEAVAERDVAAIAREVKAQAEAGAQVIDKGLMGGLMATEVLLGRDEYCLDYIGAFREGRF